MDIALLDYKVKKAGLNAESIASNLGITTLTYYHKRRGDYEFKRIEIQKLKDILDLNSEEVVKIFFK